MNERHGSMVHLDVEHTVVAQFEVVSQWEPIYDPVFASKVVDWVLRVPDVNGRADDSGLLDLFLDILVEPNKKNLRQQPYISLN